MPKVKSTDISFALDGKVVLLVDDVLYTGRTVRAALDELMSLVDLQKLDWRSFLIGVTESYQLELIL